MSIHTRLALAAAAVFLVASPASAGVTVTVNEAPLRVRPGEPIEIRWTVSGVDAVASTGIFYGRNPRFLHRTSEFHSGSAGTFSSPFAIAVSTPAGTDFL